MNNYFKLQCAAILLIAAGYGWAGGHYIPADANLLAYVFQLIVLGILLLLAIKFFSRSVRQHWEPNWSDKGLTIFSMLSFIINIANIIHGAYNSGTNTFGSHNTFADLVPIVFLITGSGLWLTTIFITKLKSNHPRDSL